MKKGIFLSLFLILAVTLNIGCDALDFESDITFDIKFVAQSDTPDFNVIELLDADSLSDDIDKYSGLIKEIELLEVTYQITSVGDSNMAGQVITATLSVADENGQGEEVIGTVANQDITTMPTPTPLPLEQEGMHRFEELVKNDPHRGLIKLIGNTDLAPTDFTVVFFFKVKMTASPL
jgi:hypothetical protein